MANNINQKYWPGDLRFVLIEINGEIAKAEILQVSDNKYNPFVEYNVPGYRMANTWIEWFDLKLKDVMGNIKHTREWDGEKYRVLNPNLSIHSQEKYID